MVILRASLLLLLLLFLGFTALQTMAAPMPTLEEEGMRTVKNPLANLYVDQHTGILITDPVLQAESVFDNL